METEIIKPSDIYPGFLYPASQLVNFMYEPIGAVFSLTLDGFNGYTTFKPMDCYAFRMWLTAHNIREHNPPKYHEQITTISMQKGWNTDRANTKPEPLPELNAISEQQKQQKEKAEIFFRNLLLVFSLIVGLVFALIMLYVTIVKWYFPLSH